MPMLKWTLEKTIHVLYVDGNAGCQFARIIFMTLKHAHGVLLCRTLVHLVFYKLRRHINIQCHLVWKKMLNKNTFNHHSRM